MQELIFEELTLEQKLGMVMTAQCRDVEKGDFDYALQMIKEHKLGAIWILERDPHFKEKMEAIHKAADYPILIVTDAESGMDDFKIGYHGSLGLTGSPEHAYIFGKVTGLLAKQKGYRLVCNPVVDMEKENVPCCGTVRSMGADSEKVSQLAIAVAQGLHDAGVLSMAKHYPSPLTTRDTHMAEGFSEQTEQDLLQYSLKPYLAMLKAGVLDSVMTSHTKLPNIDPDYPASLSQKVLGILRRQGFEGVMMTDALCMMGVVAKFGKQGSKGLAIGAGNDLILGWEDPNHSDYEALLKAYEAGIISPARLDEAVRHVLAMQHKWMELDKSLQLTAQDEEDFRAILRDGIVAAVDPGLAPSISREGRHYFIVLEENAGIAQGQQPEISVATFSNSWYDPNLVERRLTELFPNSFVARLNEFPNEHQNIRVLEQEIAYDDVVFITFNRGNAYQGAEHFTHRLLSVMEAMQVTNRISTILHFGNPFLLEETVHIPRRLLGSACRQSLLEGINVLAGNYPPKGTFSFPLQLK